MPKLLEAKVPTIKDHIEATNSVVHQMFEDQEDIGKEIDQIAGDTESIQKILRKFYRDQHNFEKTIKKTIADEVEKQIKPLAGKLDELTASNPKVVYVKLRLPNPFGWFFRLVFRKK